MALSDLPGILEMVLWGALATAAMTGMMQGALGLGLSRLSIPFMVGAMFRGNGGLPPWFAGPLSFLAAGAFRFCISSLLTALNLRTSWPGGRLGRLQGHVCSVHGATAVKDTSVPYGLHLGGP